MKKTIALILSLMLCLPLCACGGGGVQDTETVEITAGNWQDYFEIKLAATVHKDDFGEYENAFAGCYIYLKKEYRDRIVSAEVAFGWNLNEYGSCLFTHDLETGAVSYSDYTPTSTGMSKEYDDGTCSFVYGEERQKIYVRIYNGSTATDSFSVDGNTATWEGFVWEKVDITKVQGSITIAK
jgi:hypothetical protein